jgi:hypothetical protein
MIAKAESNIKRKQIKNIKVNEEAEVQRSDENTDQNLQRHLSCSFLCSVA